MLNCREAGYDLLRALTAFVSMGLAGQCPKDVVAFLAAVSLPWIRSAVEFVPL